MAADTGSAARRSGYFRFWHTMLGPAYQPPPPLLSREPLVVESRARWHSKALYKTLQKHLSELKIEVTSGQGQVKCQNPSF